jgi:predicted ATPase
VYHEAGIGKSRLTTALLEHLATEPHARLRNFCSPQHTDSALYPTIGQTERAAGFAHDNTPQAKLDKLDALLAQSSTSAHDAALLADMLSLPNDGRYPAPSSGLLPGACAPRAVLLWSRNRLTDHKPWAASKGERVRRQSKESHWMIASK